MTRTDYVENRTYDEIKVGDTITVTLTATRKFDHNRHIVDRAARYQSLLARAKGDGVHSDGGRASVRRRIPRRRGA